MPRDKKKPATPQTEQIVEKMLAAATGIAEKKGQGESPPDTSVFAVGFGVDIFGRRAVAIVTAHGEGRGQTRYFTPVAARYYGNQLLALADLVEADEAADAARKAFTLQWRI